jgi:hypothetical protein
VAGSRGRAFACLDAPGDDPPRGSRRSDCGRSRTTRNDVAILNLGAFRGPISQYAQSAILGRRVFAGLSPCRRRDSNPRHADYDSRPFWLSHRGFEAGWTSRWTQPHLRPRRVLRVRALQPRPQTARGSARAGPIRASVGTGVGTRWEQIASPHGSCCPLVSSSESLAVQGVLDENTAYGPARATFYGTEGQRFESSRARWLRGDSPDLSLGAAPKVKCSEPRYRGPEQHLLTFWRLFWRRRQVLTE